MNGSEKGDLVRVQLHPIWRNDLPNSGKVMEILEKAPKEFPGTIAVDNKGHSWVIDDAKKLKPTFVDPKDLKSALNGDRGKKQK